MNECGVVGQVMYWVVGGDVSRMKWRVNERVKMIAFPMLSSNDEGFMVRLPLVILHSGRLAVNTGHRVRHVAFATRRERERTY